MKGSRIILTIALAVWSTLSHGQDYVYWNQKAMDALAGGRAEEAEQIIRSHEDVFIAEGQVFFYCSQVLGIGLLRYGAGSLPYDSLANYGDHATAMATVMYRSCDDPSSLADADLWEELQQLAKYFELTGNELMDFVVGFSELYDSVTTVRNPAAMVTLYVDAYRYHHTRGDNDQTIILAEAATAYSLEHCDSTLLVPTSELLLGNAYMNANRRDDAELWLINSYTDYQPYLTSPPQSDYLLLLQLLSHLYSTGDSELALYFSKEYLKASEALYGDDSRDRLMALNYLATALMAAQDYEGALDMLKEAYRMSVNTQHLTVAEKAMVAMRLNASSSYLGKTERVPEPAGLDSLSESDYHTLRYMEGQDHLMRKEYGQALPLLQEVLDYYEQHFNIYLAEGYYRIAVGISTIYMESGQPDVAERNLNRAIAFVEGHDKSSKMERHLYSAKGMIHLRLTNYAAAVSNFEHSLKLFDEVEDRSLSYVMCLNNLALAYLGQERYDEAATLLVKACDYLHLNDEGFGGVLTSDHLHVVNNIGYLQDHIGNHEEAVRLYDYVITRSKDSPDKRGAYSLALSNKAISMLSEGHYAEALQLMDEAEKHMVDYSMLYRVLSNQVVAAELSNDPSVVDRLRKYNAHVHEEVGRIFSMFTEQERENFWTEQSHYLLGANNSVAFLHQQGEVLTMAYDNALYSKTLLLRSNRLLDELSEQSADPATRSLHATLQNLRRQLTAQTLTEDSILMIRQQIDQLEKRLISSIPDFSQRLQASFSTTGEVSRMLDSSEVAVEFIYLPHIIEANRAEMYYGALVLHPGSSAPQLVRLCHSDSLLAVLTQGKLSDSDFANKVYAADNDVLFRMIWQPLQHVIGKASTIYYSPTGLLSNINHAALSDGSRRLDDRWHFVQLSSTAHIAAHKRQGAEKPSRAVVYGGINYNTKPADMLLSAHSYRKQQGDHGSSAVMLAQRGDDRAGWRFLPGTLTEAQKIDTLLTQHGIDVRLYSASDANEESFKSLDGLSPDLIHIATHGFFFDQPGDARSDYFSHIGANTAKDQSMLYSGIVMAGANNAWQGRDIDSSLEDGILTAEEISRLDLSAARLVVLSACQTALGNVDDVDGVYGLQRGLKKAGARCIVMSLWRVPDEATSQLMASFYEAFSEGMSASEALRAARASVKQTYPDPYSWAAFVAIE